MELIFVSTSPYGCYHEQGKIFNLNFILDIFTKTLLQNFGLIPVVEDNSYFTLSLNKIL
jgi:hypothetical protein